ncbi:MAG: hypothetical protein VW708_07870, partial [Ilumatobacter sp.]
LPPVTWDQVATREDLRALEVNLRAEISVSASCLRTEMADLRTEMADLRTEVRTELAGVRTEMAHLRTDLRTEISDAITRQTRWMLGFALARPSVMTTVTRLIP